MTLLDASAVPFSTPMTVRPRHCDAQGMLHAARFYEYFEEAIAAGITE
jgi:acyl-CoA thioesterase FadM